jgi:hypothetical protein
MKFEKILFMCGFPIQRKAENRACVTGYSGEAMRTTVTRIHFLKINHISDLTGS